MTQNSGAGFIVRGSNGRPIGCVIGARGSPLRFTAWGRTRLGDFSSEAAAVAAVRQAHFKRKQEASRHPGASEGAGK